MNESTKTISLIIAAAAVLLLAFATRPAAPSAATEAIVGKSLFPELDDPLKATRMRIVTFDDAAGKAKEFEVAKSNGVWSLPSHKNYPVDAKEQMSAAATALVDLKVLSPVSKAVTDHELYGVVEPKPDEDQLGQKGIGKLVEVQGEGGKPLAKIIIGKEDKPTKPDEMGMGPQTQLRFVRKPGQDQVYKVQMKADKFTSKFADWIETDLLKLSPWDITDIQLHDYAVVNGVTRSGEVRPMIDRHADADLTFDDKTGKWSLKEMTDYKDGQSKPVKLAEAEEVNTDKLNDLKNALGSLKIIDVARKPAHMSENLKADKNFMDDIEMMQDLARRGFLPAQGAGDEFDIASSDGEAIVRMKDGVEYVLRFGKVAGIESPTDDEKKDDEKSADGKGKAGDEKSADKTAGDKAAEKSGDKKDAGGLSRYLMVMARYNPDVLPKPELAPLPEVKKAPEKPTADAGKAGAKAGEKSPDKKGEAKSDAKAADTKADPKTDAKAADKKGASAKADSKADAKDTKKDEAKKDDTKKDNAKKDEAKASDAKATDEKSGDAASDDVEAQELERDRVEKENHRKQEAYDEQVKKAQQHAKELNSRFADWYYVVGNDTYGKIHLGKDDIVKKKAATPSADDPNAPHDPFQLQGIPGMPPALGGKK